LQLTRAKLSSGSGYAKVFTSELSLPDKIDNTKSVALLERDCYCTNLPDGMRKQTHGSHMTEHEGSM